jgi:hypothetical protein
MAVVDELRALRDRALGELAAAHDYFTDTKIAWHIVHKVVQSGHRLTIRD